MNSLMSISSFSIVEQRVLLNRRNGLLLRSTTKSIFSDNHQKNISLIQLAHRQFHKNARISISKINNNNGNNTDDGGFLESSSSSSIQNDTVAFPLSEAFQGDFPSDNQSAAFEDLTTSFKGVSMEPFAESISSVLNAPIDPKDIEVKPDGLIYLPEIKYRRILMRAFGVGGWGLVPRGPHSVNNRNISREYALFCRGRFVSQARGEQDYFGNDKLPTAAEGCKSNALMRNCKDLGIASELWDPAFIREFKSKYCALVPAININTNSKKYVWRRKDREVEYPFKEDKGTGNSYNKK